MTAVPSLGLFFASHVTGRAPQRTEPTEMDPVKVVIADDDPLTRLDLRS